MLVSAVSANNNQTVFHTKIKNPQKNNTAFKVLANEPETTTEDITKIFDSINEWKNFCHKQIEQGNLDIVL